MSELPKEWLRLAQEDFKTAQVLFEESIWSQVCFHAQQAAEKGLKALLETKKEVPKIHDLLELANEAEKQGFSTSTRYPFLTAVLPHGIPGPKEAKQAVRGLGDFLRFVQKIIAS